MRYVAEYDENGCVWLVDTETKARLALEHGTLLHILTITPPDICHDACAQEDLA